MRAVVHFPTAPPDPHTPVKWRAKHKIEGGWPKTPPSMPEVMPPIFSGRVKMTKAIQEMSFALMRAINPAVTGSIWRRCHSDGRAMNNFSGFIDGTGGIPRADYINNRDLSEPLPAYDKAQRVFGGSLIDGVVHADKLVCTAGIHGIDADAPMPSVETIIKNHWYVVAVNVNADFTVMSDWAQGQGGHIAFPFIFHGVIEFDLQYFQAWEGAAPDPLKVYL